MPGVSSRIAVRPRRKAALSSTTAIRMGLSGLVGFILIMAVNAKTPRGKDARCREKGRESELRITHRAGECAKQLKPLRLGTLAPLRWFNFVLQLHGIKRLDGARSEEHTS